MARVNQCVDARPLKISVMPIAMRPRLYSIADLFLSIFYFLSESCCSILLHGAKIRCFFRSSRSNERSTIPRHHYEKKYDRKEYKASEDDTSNSHRDPYAVAPAAYSLNVIGTLALAAIELPKHINRPEKTEGDEEIDHK
jgi:hypothetical protein